MIYGNLKKGVPKEIVDQVTKNIQELHEHYKLDNQLKDSASKDPDIEVMKYFNDKIQKM